MGMLKKELALYERDEKGILIPQKRTLELSEADMKQCPEYKDMEIMVIPLTRGELKKAFGLGGKDSDKKPDTDRDEDAEVIMKYCKDPVFTAEEAKYAKPIIVRSIVRTIFSESGVKIDDNAGTKKFEENDEFGKNS